VQSWHSDIFRGTAERVRNGWRLSNPVPKVMAKLTFIFPSPSRCLVVLLNFICSLTFIFPFYFHAFLTFPFPPFLALALFCFWLNYKQNKNNAWWYKIKRERFWREGRTTQTVGSINTRPSLNSASSHNIKKTFIVINRRGNKEDLPYPLFLRGCENEQ